MMKMFYTMQKNSTPIFCRENKNSYSNEVTQFFSGCPIIRVSLKNEVLHKLGFLQGDYQISTKLRNQKPMWIKRESIKSTYVFRALPTYAIYYRRGDWAIGPMKSNNDGEFAWIYASNDFSGLTDNENVWKFSNGSNFVCPLNPRDIRITYRNEW